MSARLQYADVIRPDFTDAKPLTPLARVKGTGDGPAHHQT
jgi:hypothetical protein